MEDPYFERTKADVIFLKIIDKDKPRDEWEEYELKDDVLDRGSFGDVYEVEGSKKIVKLVELPEDPRKRGKLLDNLRQETAIQYNVSKKIPGICPEIYAYGIVQDGEGTGFLDEDDEYDKQNVYAIVMEKCEGTARSWFRQNPNNADEMLSYLEQLATMLEALAPYEFNHRDLKSDNVMYKTVENKKKYLLIDFGFSCATFDKKQYVGGLYSTPDMKCFRESRDLALAVFELLGLSTNKDMRKFLHLVLTFDFKGTPCDMSKGCLPDFSGEWLHAYDFLNRPDVNNPNTTPTGLRKAIAAFREGGIKACKAGFIINPINKACVPEPGAPVPAALEPPADPPIQSSSKGGRKTVRRKKNRKTLRRQRKRSGR